MKPRALTITEVAGRYGVSAEVVLAWVRNGDLRATNVASSAKAKRPTWRVTAEALAAFEAARSATPEQPAPKARRKKPVGDVIEFYT